MRTDEPTQSNASNEENRAESASSQSRRGFLQKTAATGVLSMGGMAVASGVASADGGERDEDNRQTHEDSLVVLGNHDNTYYLFGTTGDIDHGWTAEDSDDQITSFSGDKVQGFIGDGGRDGFGFNGQIKYVHIRGDATIIVDFDNVNF